MPKFYTISQLADQANFLVQDYQQIKRMRFNKLAADFVFPDMQLDIIKDAKREFMYINKRTNTLKLPCDCLRVSSVSVIDQCGNIWPVYINKNLYNDIIDYGAKKDCACSCGGDLCNMIKGYESVITTIDAEMPDTTIKAFKCTNRKWYSADGTYYEQTQTPQREYENGIWVDTVIGTTDVELCKLELTESGCVSDCEENYQAVTSCGCKYYGDYCGVNIPVPTELDGFQVVERFQIESGKWFSTPRYLNNNYNINDAGDQLIFPCDFGFDRVLLRYYVDTAMQEMKIPSAGAYAFICGIMWYDIAFDRSQVQLERLLSQRYIKAKAALSEELNKYTSAEMSMMTSPPTHIPSSVPYYAYNNF